MQTDQPDSAFNLQDLKAGSRKRKRKDVSHLRKPGEI